MRYSTTYSMEKETHEAIQQQAKKQGTNPGRALEAMLEDYFQMKKTLMQEEKKPEEELTSCESCGSAYSKLLTECPACRDKEEYFFNAEINID